MLVTKAVKKVENKIGKIVPRVVGRTMKFCGE